MQELTHREQETLRTLLREMIPPSASHGAPGADDAAIVEDILRSMRRETDNVRSALGELNARSDGGFVALGDADRRETALDFLNGSGPHVFALSRLVLQCYYRDDRVMASLGMDARPPFPAGFDVEQGDWSLLDPVREMPKIYRKVD
jgi:hypothetical protein